jgi:hypothetical protein
MMALVPEKGGKAIAFPHSSASHALKSGLVTVERVFALPHAFSGRFKTPKTLSPSHWISRIINENRQKRSNVPGGILLNG